MHKLITYSSNERHMHMYWWDRHSYHIKNLSNTHNINQSKGVLVTTIISYSHVFGYREKWGERRWRRGVPTASMAFLQNNKTGYKSLEKQYVRLLLLRHFIYIEDI